MPSGRLSHPFGLVLGAAALCTALVSDRSIEALHAIAYIGHLSRDRDPGYRSMVSALRRSPSPAVRDMVVDYVGYLWSFNRLFRVFTRSGFERLGIAKLPVEPKPESG